MKIELFKTMNAIKRKNISVCVVVLECKLSRKLKIGEFQNDEGEGFKIYIYIYLACGIHCCETMVRSSICRHSRKEGVFTLIRTSELRKAY